MTASWHRPAWVVALAALLWLAAPFLPAAEPLPASPTPHYIRDDAGWLKPEEFQALDEKLKAFERETSSQFVVAIFPKIPEDGELFDFSQRLYESWKPGGAEKDNGAIFLIFAHDRKMRIHTGFGMEGVLPDARCKQIIADIVAPRLRQGDRAAAINAGIDAMIAAAKGEYQGTGRTRLDESRQAEPSGWLPLIFILIVFAVLMSRKFAARPPTPAEVIFSQFGPRPFDGWGSSGSSGGGFGGGGFSGGGFSGGGGSSGGGGASGDW